MNFSRRFDGRRALTGQGERDFISARMKRLAAIFMSILLSSAAVRAADQAKLLPKVTPLPVALSDDFQFRKVKLFFLDEKALSRTKKSGATPGAKGGTAGAGEKTSKSKYAKGQDASIQFERKYRLFGAVTLLDQRQRVGNYFDFFWRTKRPANLTVRLEYRQEKLHSLVQAKELYYPNAKGNMKSEFTVIGDDYFDDGAVMAWRCLLIEDGRIVAMKRSYLWE
ncbi:MAG: hypothetical protein QOI04_539 [Verrucomicrobiota bacterium]|jgi:hypothetical protein